MRMVIALAAVASLAAAGCDEKKDAAERTTVVAPAPTPTTAVVAPVAPSGEPTKAEPAHGEKAATKTAAKPPTPTPTTSGAMPHGNPENGTLKYNPPPAPPNPKQ
jgi:hypothetical protein